MALDMQKCVRVRVRVTTRWITVDNSQCLHNVTSNHCFAFHSKNRISPFTQERGLLCTGLGTCILLPLPKLHRFGRKNLQQPTLRSDVSTAKSSILRVRKKKKWTVSKFLHTGAKKGVEKEYTIIFYDFFDTKIRHTF